MQCDTDLQQWDFCSEYRNFISSGGVPMFACIEDPGCQCSEDKPLCKRGQDLQAMVNAINAHKRGMK